MRKILSISIAAYNSEKWLNKCLDSFLVQDIMDDIEVIVVNDGSSDNTYSIAKEYMDRYPGVFVAVDKENGGHGSTINKGIELATGKYFKNVDADDWVGVEGIRDLVRTLKNNDVDMVMTPYYVVHAKDNSKVKKELICDSKIESYKVMEVKRISDCINLEMHGITFRTEILKNSKYRLDEHCFYVDVEYNIFYFSDVKTVLFTDIPVYHYLLGIDEQSMSYNNMIKRREQHLKVCKRLLKFYKGNCDRMQEANKRIIRRRIENVIILEYNILLNVKDVKISKKEIMEFDRFLSKESMDLYISSLKYGIKVKSMTAVLVTWLRNMGFCGYYPAHLLVKGAVKFYYKGNILKS